MRFGLALPQYGFSLADGATEFSETAAWAQRAEAVGFDSVWLSDHLFYTFARYGADPAPLAALEPMTALAGIAATTQRVRLGTLVVCAPFRHPAVLAKMAVTIDRISGGRLDLGVGAGWLGEEFTAFGLPFGSVGERFALLEETLGALSALQSGTPATYVGSSVALHEARLLPGPVHGHMPILLGGKGGPRLLGLAARYADGWNTVWRVNPEAYAPRSAAADAACEAIARDPSSLRRTVGLYTVVGEDEAAARSAFERGRATFPGGAMEADTWETWRSDTLSGSPEQAVERVHELERLGIDEIVVSPWTLPFAVPEPEIVDVFAEGVIAPIRASA